jgi:hypothetical protein
MVVAKQAGDTLASVERRIVKFSPSFYSPIRGGRIELRPPSLRYLPPRFDEASLICENDPAFVRAKSVVRGPYPGQGGSPERHSASAESEQGLTLNGTPLYHPTVFYQTGVI